MSTEEQISPPLAAEGWIDSLPNCKGQPWPVSHIPSPNFDSRPAGADVSLLVIHAISLPPEHFGGDEIFRLFTNTLDPHAHPFFAQIHTLRVSAHFLIRRDGGVVQFVSCQQRAWHAGVSVWQERERCNDYSIGIELEGSDNQAFTPLQYKALSALCCYLCERYPVQGIMGHEHIAPGRKTDPGPYFDWGFLRAALPRVLFPPKG